MILIYFFRYFFGYVRIAFYGDFCDRILNLSAQQRVTLWDIKKTNKGVLEANVSVKNFKKMRTIRAKSEIKVKILKKIGFPFILKKHSKRIGFAVGIVAFFFVLNFLSGYVWKIEVVGNEKISKETILSVCDELGIFKGASKEKINTETAKEKLLIKLKGLAWASLNIEGCRLTVNVSEIKNNVTVSEQPSNLLAKVDGVIKRIDVKTGNCVVKVGDAVVKGDILVSGVQNFEESGTIKKVKSKGEIIAKTKRIFTVKVDKTQRKNIISDKAITKNVLSFFGINIPLYLGEIKHPYVEKTALKELKLFGETLPVSVTKKSFYPTREIEIKLSTEEAITQGSKIIDNAVKNAEFFDFKLIEEHFEEGKELIKIIKTYECEENVAYEVVF